MEFRLNATDYIDLVRALKNQDSELTVAEVDAELEPDSYVLHSDVMVMAAA